MDWNHLRRFILRASWNSIKYAAKVLLRVVLSGLVVAAAWYGFLRLVKKPPVETNAALVMVWLSALVVLLALFPKILDAIKKIKDFEIELQEAVAKSTTEDYISLFDLDGGLVVAKGDFRRLQQLLELVRGQPTRPVLLIANLRDGHYISKPVLFIYAFFLEQIAHSVTVLFVSAPDDAAPGDMASESIVGAISGRALLQVFRRHFPWFANLGGVPVGDEDPLASFLKGGAIPDSRFFDRIRRRIWGERQVDEDEYLSRDQVQNWLGPGLNKRTIDVESDSGNLSGIRRALEAGEEFVISMERDRFRSVIALCEFSREVAETVLAEAHRKKL